MSSLVSATSSSGGSSSLLIFALLLLMIGWMFYSQRRRTRQGQALQASLEVGNEVITTSGLLGRITALDDQIATLEVSPGVSIRFNRRAISGPAPTASGSPTESASSEPEIDPSSDPTRPTD